MATAQNAGGQRRAVDVLAEVSYHLVEPVLQGTIVSIGSGTGYGLGPYGLTPYGGGSGTTVIAHEDSPDKLTVVQTLKTQPRARTMTLDPKTHKIYLATGAGGNFRVLVFGMQ